MIKKVNIKKFGLFNDFLWQSKVRDKGNNEVFFKKENIIYGRNYSGKTTLSRIIRSLETKTISEKYENPEFEIELEANSKINQNDYKQNSLKIRVFNEDFVRENLSFIVDPNGQINPFAILGDNTTIQPQIDALSSELGVKDEGKETGLYKNLIEIKGIEKEKESELNIAKRNLDNQLTNKAREIKQENSKFGDVNYNYTKINTDINLVTSPNLIPIDSEKEKQNEQIIKEETKSDINISLFEQFKLNEFIEKAQQLLSKDILSTNKIAELVKNSALNNWVKEGYDLHKENKDKCKCGFCGNLISENRWAELDKHFDEETERLKKELFNFQNGISNEINNIPNLPNKNIFYSEFQNEAEDILNNLQAEYLRYKNDIENIKNKIKEREENILQTLDFSFKPSFQIETFNSLKQSLYDLIQKNKQYSEELSTKQNNAKKELRLLEVKKFLDIIQYSDLLRNISSKETAYNTEKEKRENLEDNIKQKEQIKKDLESQLNDESLGARKVNNYLNNFFGHQNLTLEATEDNSANKKIKFEIKRDGITAYHLSEGECSLVAFCYFMAKLDDVETSGQKPIIYIDDPISSLDSNHIFYVYSLINSELFHKDRFEQIFISTHNLEFLKYIKKLKFTKNNHQYFILNRSKNKTDICLMPSYLKNYITEFNFLFHQIYKCANDNIVDDSNFQTFYNFGNNARKFLEILLSYKYPNAKIEGKLSKYFDHQEEIQINRVNNEFSHLIGLFERGNNIPENNFTEMQKVAKFILQKIEEKDKEQYDALLESIGEKITNI